MEALDVFSIHVERSKAIAKDASDEACNISLGVFGRRTVSFNHAEDSMN